MFLPVGPGCTHRRQFDVRERRDTCFAAALLPHRAPCRFVPSTPSHLRRRGTLCIGEMSSRARTPRDEGCSPVPAVVRRALRGATVQSLHCFADGSPGCQGASSFPALFILLRLHLRSGAECCCPNTLETSSLPCPVSRICNRSFNSDFLSVPLGTLAKSRRQRQRQSKAHDW